MLVAAAALAVLSTLTEETLDPIDGVSATSNVICGAYGDPHIYKSDGSFVNHMGQGEYQLFSAPAMAADVHYFGCGVAQGDSTGTYMGAIAIKIGSVSIEIVANDLSVVGGTTYDVDYDNDKPMGPYSVHAGSTTVSIEREAITSDKLWKAQGSDKRREAKGIMLYRWTISTPEGLVIHSHAAMLKIAEGSWAMDVHINYPASLAAKTKGLCIDKCDVFDSADSSCGDSSACSAIHLEGTYGIYPIFSNSTLTSMEGKCPFTKIDKTCPPKSPTGPEACETNNISLSTAMLACIHLNALSDTSYHDACVFDYCSGGSEAAAEEWYMEHNPPEDVKCKAVADPRFSTFSEYAMDFKGDGFYSLVEKTSTGDTDPCAIKVQSLECPGSNTTYAGASYMAAIGIEAVGGTSNHIIILEEDKCTLDGRPCGTFESCNATNSHCGKNVGVDGVKLIPYQPIPGTSENMGEFGPGSKGWYVYAMGFAVNVTVTYPSAGSEAPGRYMMNVITAAPPMCTSDSTGLCSTTAATSDTALQAYAAAYSNEHAVNTPKKHQPFGKKGHPGGKHAGALLAASEMFDSVPTMPSYPALSTDKILTGLGGLICPQAK
jgi:hypothetical protein